MSNRAKVSGHSGLPEEVELRMLEEKIEKKRIETEQMYQDFLRLMNFHGIAPSKRRMFLVRFSKWLVLHEEE